MRPNQRKYCYNCAQAGHFGFECPLEHDSNYPLDNPYKTALFDVPSLSSGESDRVMISISEKQSQLLHSDRGDEFLRRYVNDSNFTINLFPGINNYVQIIGDNVTSNNFEEQLEKWLSELSEVESDWDQTNSCKRMTRRLINCTVSFVFFCFIIFIIFIVPFYVIYSVFFLFGSTLFTRIGFFIQNGVFWKLFLFFPIIVRRGSLWHEAWCDEKSLFSLYT